MRHGLMFMMTASAGPLRMNAYPLMRAPVVSSFATRYMSKTTSQENDALNRKNKDKEFTTGLETHLTKELIAQAMKKLGACPPVNAQQVKLVTETWAPVKKLGTAATDIFYQQLFGANPDFKNTMFRNVDQEKQKKRLFNMLDISVGWLGKPEELVPMLQACGARHVYYNVGPEHYPAVGAALLATLKLGLGNLFTPEAKEAWTAVYGVIQY